EVDIIKKTENQAKMTKLSMEWKRLCKIKAKAQQYNYEDCEDQMGPQSITTAHLCAIDKDCEDFEGPILAQLQPISAIVHTKPTPTPYWA
ncbi:hypothetical protein Tco_0601179, partial [Tanacetum coccineum]